jgi:hypothetical protein
VADDAAFAAHTDRLVKVATAVAAWTMFCLLAITGTVITGVLRHDFWGTWFPFVVLEAGLAWVTIGYGLLIIHRT